MAANIDWDEVEKETKPVNSYKDWAPEGVFTTKVGSVELIVSKNKGTQGIKFNLADTDDYQFPLYGATAWLSKDKIKWRQHHMKELFVALGFTEAQARKAVEQCEDSDDLGKSYLAMFEKALPKSKPVEIEVFKLNEGDKYPTWDFTSNKVRMNHPNKGKKSDNPLDDAVELTTEETDGLDMPF